MRKALVAALLSSSHTRSAFKETADVMAAPSRSALSRFRVRARFNATAPVFIILRPTRPATRSDDRIADSESGATMAEAAKRPAIAAAIVKDGSPARRRA